MSEFKPIPTFPGIAKLFVAMFTTLMLLVCLWAVWIYTIEKGELDEHDLPDYLKADAVSELSDDDEIDLIAEDTTTARAPVWTMEHLGEDVPLDSAQIAQMEIRKQAIEPNTGDHAGEIEAERESRLRHNLGLAHVHINGQLLLFFALGAIFLFTSVKKSLKRIILWVFGLTILAHTVGLSGEGFHWLFDDMLAVSGVLMLALIAYMCLMIYVDLGRTPRKN